MSLAVAWDGLFAQQLQHTLGVDGGLNGLAHHTGGVVEAQIHIPGGLQRAAQLLAKAGGVQAVSAQFHQILATHDVAAGGSNAAAGVLDQAAHCDIRAHLTGLLRLGELAVAVIHKDDDLRVCGAGGIGNFADGSQIKGVAL